MDEGILNNYWMQSGSDRYLRYFLAEKSSFLVDYSGLKVSQDFARDPGEIDEISPQGFLYQAGYLVLRRDDDDKLSLDYPNGEVRKSMARLSVLAMMDDSVLEIDTVVDELSGCLGSGNPKELFKHFRRILSDFSYQSLVHGAQKLNNFAAGAPGKKPQKKQPGENVYQKFLQKYLDGAGVLAKREESGNLGRSDLVVRFLNKTYVIELKMAKEKNGALKAAQAGLDQIRGNNYGGRYKHPILLSLGLDKDLRNAVACVFAIGKQEGRLVVGEDGEIAVADSAKTEAPSPAAKASRPSRRRPKP
jgi:hypothetical protein